MVLFLCGSDMSNRFLGEKFRDSPDAIRERLKEFSDEEISISADELIAKNLRIS